MLCSELGAMLLSLRLSKRVRGDTRTVALAACCPALHGLSLGRLSGEHFAPLSGLSQLTQLSISGALWLRGAVAAQLKSCLAG